MTDKCELCMGNGWVLDLYQKQYECPKCNGVGTLPEQPHASLAKQIKDQIKGDRDLNPMVKDRPACVPEAAVRIVSEDGTTGTATGANLPTEYPQVSGADAAVGKTLSTTQSASLDDCLLTDEAKNQIANAILQSKYFTTWRKFCDWFLRGYSADGEQFCLDLMDEVTKAAVAKAEPIIRADQQSKDEAKLFEEHNTELLMKLNQAFFDKDTLIDNVRQDEQARVLKKVEKAFPEWAHTSKLKTGYANDIYAWVAQSERWRNFKKAQLKSGKMPEEK